MTNPDFNEELYSAFLKALVVFGIPTELAEGAACVFAKDNPHEDNLGRSPEDQVAVDLAMQQGSRKNSSPKQ